MKVKYFIIFFLISCSKEIEVNFNSGNFLAIYPLVESDKFIKFFVYPTLKIRDTTIHESFHAFAYIYNNLNCLDTVYINNKGFGQSKIKAIENVTYDFEVIAEGYESAKTSVKVLDSPSNWSIDTSEISIEIAKGFPQKELAIYVTLFDNPLQKDYYKISILNKNYKIINNTYPYQYGFEHRIWGNSITSFGYLDFYNYYENTIYLSKEEYSPLSSKSVKIDINGELYVQGGTFYFNDQFFNGSAISLQLIPIGLLASLNNSNMQLQVHLSKINPEYYKGLFSYGKYNIHQINDFPITEPSPIFNSTQGGFGFAAASATAIDSSISSEKYKAFFKQK